LTAGLIGLVIPSRREGKDPFVISDPCRVNDSGLRHAHLGRRPGVPGKAPELNGSGQPVAYCSPSPLWYNGETKPCQTIEKIDAQPVFRHYLSNIIAHINDLLN
jgi:hypothetical protein